MPSVCPEVRIVPSVFPVEEVDVGAVITLVCANPLSTNSPKKTPESSLVSLRV